MGAKLRNAAEWSLKRRAGTKRSEGGGGRRLEPRQGTRGRAPEGARGRQRGGNHVSDLSLRWEKEHQVCIGYEDRPEPSDGSEVLTEPI